MLSDFIILSKNAFFIKGMENILENISLPITERRCVFIDASLAGLMFDYSPLDNDAFFYITPDLYSNALQSLFYDFFSNGVFIAANKDTKLFKLKIIKLINTVKPTLSYRTKLSLMEIRVLKTLIAKGTNARCAKSLNISRKTVSAHKSNAMKKLGIEKISHLLILFNKLIF